MSGWLRRRGWLDVERSDWVRVRGRHATLQLGPFGFYVDTADGGTLGFTIDVGPTALGWFWDGRP